MVRVLLGVVLLLSSPSLACGHPYFNPSTGDRWGTEWQLQGQVVPVEQQAIQATSTSVTVQSSTSLELPLSSWSGQTGQLVSDHYTCTADGAVAWAFDENTATSDLPMFLPPASVLDAGRRQEWSFWYFQNQVNTEVQAVYEGKEQLFTRLGLFTAAKITFYRKNAVRTTSDTFWVGRGLGVLKQVHSVFDGVKVTTSSFELVRAPASSQKVMQTVQAAGSSQAVVLEVMSPENNSRFSADTITLKLRVLTGNKDDLDYQVTVNGRVVTTTARDIALTGPDEVRLVVPIQDSSPRLNVVVTAKDPGGKASEPVRLTLFKALPIQAQPSAPSGQPVLATVTPGDRKTLYNGNLYLLAVGIDEYRNLPREYFLQFSKKDAVDLSEAFLKSGRSVYQKMFTYMLQNDQATRSNIRQAMDDIQARARPQDTVIVLFSGHGETDGGQYYVITHDTDLQNLAETAVSQEHISHFYQHVRAQTLILLDTCRSGGINGVKGLKSRATDSLVTAMVSQDASPRKTILAATRGSSYAYEDVTWGNGAFTKAILEALRGEEQVNLNNNTLTLYRLATWVSDRVKALTGNKQVPNAQIRGDDWVIAQHP